LADALDLGSSVEIRAGSSPVSPSIFVSAERRFSFWGTFLTSDHLWITRERMGMVTEAARLKSTEVLQTSLQSHFLNWMPVLSVYTEGVRSSSLLPPKAFRDQAISRCYSGYSRQKINDNTRKSQTPRLACAFVMHRIWYQLTWQMKT
jgi:hypothetical protein